MNSMKLLFIALFISASSEFIEFDESKYVKSPKSAATEDSDFGKVALDTHNYYRGLGGIAPLKWNETIANFSFCYVHYLAEIGCVSVHSPMSVTNSTEGYGDNLHRNWHKKYLVNDGVWHVRNAIDGWYKEIENYVYNVDSKNFCEETNKPKGIDDPKTGHFTAMMAERSTDVGCSYITCRRDAESWNYTVIVHCAYHPFGNINNRMIFSADAAKKLDCAPHNAMFGGLPTCGDNKKCLNQRDCTTPLGKYAVKRCSEKQVIVEPKWKPRNYSNTHKKDMKEEKDTYPGVCNMYYFKKDTPSVERATTKNADTDPTTATNTIVKAESDAVTTVHENATDAQKTSSSNPLDRLRPVILLGLLGIMRLS